MQQSFRRAVLASVLGLGVLAGLVRADGHGQPPYYRYAYPYQPVELLTAPQPTKRHLFSNHRERVHPWSCWTHHNDLGCGSLKADCAFIFGSCRTFFGEPCYRTPPVLPLPPGYEGYYGYNGYNGYNRNGCKNCP